MCKIPVDLLANILPYILDELTLTYKLILHTRYYSEYIYTNQPQILYTHTLVTRWLFTAGRLWRWLVLWLAFNCVLDIEAGRQWHTAQASYWHCWRGVGHCLIHFQDTTGLLASARWLSVISRWCAQVICGGWHHMRMLGVSVKAALPTKHTSKCPSLNWTELNWQCIATHLLLLREMIADCFLPKVLTPVLLFQCKMVRCIRRRLSTTLTLSRTSLANQPRCVTGRRW